MSEMQYRDGVPYFDPDCGGCVSGDFLNRRCAACLSVENAALRKVAEAAREAEAVITRMGEEEGWPPERLAPRLFRLRTILRAARRSTRRPPT